MSQNKKLILVIGATGAQGIAVIDALLAPQADGSPSPYAVRALTRNPDHRRAQLLAKKGVQFARGAVDDFAAVAAALEGAYGVWVNTDGFTLGEQKEIFVGMRIFEIAKQAPSLRHYVWSNLDYVFKETGYNPTYKCEHCDAKGRVGEWLQMQPSDVSDTGLSWSMVTSLPYMEMLNNIMFGPLHRREDGTFVFPTPIGNGHVPMIALADFGFFARYTFDHRAETSREELKIISDLVSWDYLVSTFTKVTGQKAVAVYQSADEWADNFHNTDRPIATERQKGDGSTTWRQNFKGLFALYRDDVVKRDLEWNRRINPNTRSVETWMRENNYTGELDFDTLKGTEDGKDHIINVERVSQL
ncbi:hypothetical protein EW026_g5192 [Hermanssonia centrifuga]|uniref:NmrA-like domain-containing protein n=1 Tax=Hermanssonia centrifuga TaxID=98765 RepID=A0A4S4KEX0_9APHY|nr:hypothetical protein EW026_g5192 [Hermanssonia centrifuga]